MNTEQAAKEALAHESAKRINELERTVASQKSQIYSLTLYINTLLSEKEAAKNPAAPDSSSSVLRAVVDPCTYKSVPIEINLEDRPPIPKKYIRPEIAGDCYCKYCKDHTDCTGIAVASVWYIQTSDRREQGLCIPCFWREISGSSPEAKAYTPNDWFEGGYVYAPAPILCDEDGNYA